MKDENNSDHALFKLIILIEKYHNYSYLELLYIII